MEEFIKMTMTPFLIIGGILTAIPIIVAIAPEKAVPQWLKLPWDEKYSVLARHWGILVAMVGISLICCIFIKSLLFPVMVFSTVQKVLMVILILSYSKKVWIKGFKSIAIVDSLLAIYSLLYFAVLIGKSSIALY
jgi:hypothetical protein